MKSAKTRTFSALPAEGRKGKAPKFPLPDVSARESELWREAWKTPQAVAWESQPWRWHSVAMWVRISALCEDREVSASLLAQVHRFADQIGLTPAGLKENGWTIASTAETAGDEESPKLASVTAIFDDLEAAGA